MAGKTREGYFYGLVAYGWWGLVPLYFSLLGDVAALEILAQRIVWSLVFLAVVLAVARRWRKVWECLGEPRWRRTLLLTAVLIAVNWYTYITAVEMQVIVQASLGFFITPLVNVLLGMFFFRERLRRLQWATLAFVAAGTVRLTLAESTFPWIAFGLAVSFSLYGLFRKRIPVDGLVGLTVETVILAPVALGYLVFLANQERLALGSGSWGLDVALACSGVVTAVPLLCFGQAAQRLPLSSLGFLQYLSPTIQFLLAVLVLGERMDPARWQSFVLIWLGLAIFVADSVRAFRKARWAERQSTT